MESQHLTDEQFSDLLCGTAPSTVKAHLEVCAQCSEEVDRATNAIGIFEQQSRLWAERRAASQPILVSHRQPVFPWLLRPQAWTAAALAIALAAGIGVAVRNDTSARKNQPEAAQQQIATAKPAPTVSPATLKTDNELLSAIDGELRSDESTPSSVYGLTATSRGVRTRMSKRVAD